jgi:hypothetical protein
VGVAGQAAGRRAAVLTTPISVTSVTCYADVTRVAGPLRVTRVTHPYRGVTLLRAWVCPPRWRAPSGPNPLNKRAPRGYAARPSEDRGEEAASTSPARARRKTPLKTAGPPVTLKDGLGPNLKPGNRSYDHPCGSMSFKHRACPLWTADIRDPKSNVREPDDDLQCSERVSSADPPCNGGHRTWAVGLRPSAVVAYTLAEEEPPTFAAGVAVVRFAAARTRPSR